MSFRYIDIGPLPLDLRSPSLARPMPMTPIESMLQLYQIHVWGLSAFAGSRLTIFCRNHVLEPPLDLRLQDPLDSMPAIPARFDVRDPLPATELDPHMRAFIGPNPGTPLWSTFVHSQFRPAAARFVAGWAKPQF